MLQMLRDRVLVRPIVRKLSDTIIVTNTEKHNLGEVFAVGPGKVVNGRLQPLDVKVGDIVRYGEFTFTGYREDGIDYQIIQEADIAAIVEDKQAA